MLVSFCASSFHEAPKTPIDAKRRPASRRSEVQSSAAFRLSFQRTPWSRLFGTARRCERRQDTVDIEGRARNSLLSQVARLSPASCPDDVLADTRDRGGFSGIAFPRSEQTTRNHHGHVVFRPRDALVVRSECGRIRDCATRLRRARTISLIALRRECGALARATSRREGPRLARCEARAAPARRTRACTRP